MARPDTWMPLKIEPWTKKTARLSLAERGAYMDLLLAYWVGGPLPADDEDTLKRMARCTDKEWKQVRTKVLAFFTRDGDVLRQGRADEELAEAAARYERRASAGRSGGQAKAKQTSKQNPSIATAEQVTEPQASYKEHSLQRETEAKASGGGKRAPPKVGSRISPDWKPSDQDEKHATDRNYAPENITKLASHFRDYHLAKGTVSRDWSASWRTWIANDQKFSAGRGSGSSGQQSRHNRQEPGSIVDLANRLKARAGVGGPHHGNGGVGRGGEWVQTPGDERDEAGVGFGAGGIILEADECERMHRPSGGDEAPDESPPGTGAGSGSATSFVR